MAETSEPGTAARRLTIRTRLTLSFAGLVTGCGAVLITLVYLYMRYVPSYRFVEVGPAVTEVLESGPTGGVAIASADDFLDNLLIASGLALIALALLSGVVGWLVAGRIIRPLSGISAAARRAASGALDHRIALGGPRDEIRDLADTFDDMLASLERSFAAQRRFTANSSHELRTPLATTKTMLDVVLADPDADVADLRLLAERVREVNHSCIETVDALLDLALADQAIVAFEPVDLRGLADAVCDEHAPEAAYGQVEVSQPTGHAVGIGSAAMIRLAISNLVRNAIRHNHPGGRVSISVSSDLGRARIVVANSGPLVAPADIELLIEPFARSAGRSLTRGSGHGLGLAIVAAVAKAHDGKLVLTPNEGGGLTATLDVPTVA